jgi:hypothetical protein
VLNTILEDIPENKFEQLKIGFYSCSTFKKMHIFVELEQTQTEWGKEGLIE